MCFRPSQPIRIKCPQCQTVNPPGVTVCTKCGANLAKPVNNTTGK